MTVPNEIVDFADGTKAFYKVYSKIDKALGQTYDIAYKYKNSKNFDNARIQIESFNKDDNSLRIYNRAILDTDMLSEKILTQVQTGFTLFGYQCAYETIGYVINTNATTGNIFEATNGFTIVSRAVVDEETSTYLVEIIYNNNTEFITAVRQVAFTDEEMLPSDILADVSIPDLINSSDLIKYNRSMMIGLYNTHMNETFKDYTLRLFTIYKENGDIDVIVEFFDKSNILVKDMCFSTIEETDYTLITQKITEISDRPTITFTELNISGSFIFKYSFKQEDKMILWKVIGETEFTNDDGEIVTRGISGYSFQFDNIITSSSTEVQDNLFKSGIFTFTNIILDAIDPSIIYAVGTNAIITTDEYQTIFVLQDKDSSLKLIKVGEVVTESAGSLNESSIKIIN